MSICSVVMVPFNPGTPPPVWFPSLHTPVGLWCWYSAGCINVAHLGIKRKWQISAVYQHPDHLDSFFVPTDCFITYWKHNLYFRLDVTLFQVQNGCWYFFWLQAYILHFIPLLFRQNGPYKWADNFLDDKKRWQTELQQKQQLTMSNWSVSI